MNQEIINLFDEFTHKPLTRNDFMIRLAKLAGGTAAAIAILPLLEVNYANAMTIAEDDEDITSEGITYVGCSHVTTVFIKNAESNHAGRRYWPGGPQCAMCWC